MNRRVVVTGMAGISALGQDWASVAEKLQTHQTGVRFMSEWDQYTDLNTRLAAPVPDFKLPKHFSRKKIRTMGRVSKMAVLSAERALEQAGLLEDPILKSGRTGVAYGSSTGSTDAVLEFTDLLMNNSVGNLNATTYIRMMGHTAPVNIGVYFGLQGRVVPTSSACTSGSQGIGYAYEAIKFGKQEVMLAGGGEELCPSEAAVFDTLYATSTKNDAPNTTPAPFDKDRDGLVIGEGAGTFVLEELQHAKARGANILCEIVGFACNSDGAHVTQPQTQTMGRAMELALEDAGLPASEIGYICAHGTATDQGDVAESNAAARVFGNNTPMSSLKGHIGHTLGACGVLESWWTVEMMLAGWFAPTLNLAGVDERCGDVDYIISDIRHKACDLVMNNNFAFGGINTSLIFKRWT